jgi:hypothetical protein
LLSRVTTENRDLAGSEAAAELGEQDVLAKCDLCRVAVRWLILVKSEWTLQQHIAGVEPALLK